MKPICLKYGQTLIVISGQLISFKLMQIAIKKRTKHKTKETMHELFRSKMLVLKEHNGN